VRDRTHDQESTALVFTDLTWAPVILEGHAIVELHRAGDLTLDAASYRIQIDEAAKAMFSRRISGTAKSPES
jgi:hypothetical protein